MIRAANHAFRAVRLGIVIATRFHFAFQNADEFVKRHLVEMRSQDITSADAARAANDAMLLKSF